MLVRLCPPSRYLILTLACVALLSCPVLAWGQDESLKILHLWCTSLTTVKLNGGALNATSSTLPTFLLSTASLIEIDTLPVRLDSNVVTAKKHKQPPVVPEPPTMFLVGIGILAAGWVLRKKQESKAATALRTPRSEINQSSNFQSPESGYK
jgi:hypothetical protein